MKIEIKPKFVQVRAYQSDREFGYDRWIGDEYSLGAGTHNAVLVIFEESDEIKNHVMDIQAALGEPMETRNKNPIAQQWQ